MQVILVQDVQSLGKKGTIVKVNDNYARNYLIPRGLGVEATKANLNDLKLKVQNISRVEAAKNENALATRKLIDGRKVTIGIKTGEGGRVFGSVTAKEVSEALKRKYKADVDRKKIVMEPMKTLGVTPVTIKLHKDIQATIEVELVPEES